MFLLGLRIYYWKRTEQGHFCTQGSQEMGHRYVDGPQPGLRATTLRLSFFFFLSAALSVLLFTNIASANSFCFYCVLSDSQLIRQFLFFLLFYIMSSVYCAMAGLFTAMFSGPCCRNPPEIDHRSPLGSQEWREGATWEFGDRLNKEGKSNVWRLVH